MLECTPNASTTNTEADTELGRNSTEPVPLNPVPPAMYTCPPCDPTPVPSPASRYKCPPVLEPLEVEPAFTNSFSPPEVDAEPTRRLTAPGTPAPVTSPERIRTCPEPAAPDDEPVRRETEPVPPTLEVPELNNKEPEEPATTALALRITMEPEDDARLEPEDTKTEPPVARDDTPAFINSWLPRPEAEEPTTRDKEPAEPE